MSDVDDDQIEDSSAPLIEHLAELRNRLIRSVIALIIGIVLAFTVSEPILQFLLRPIEATLRIDQTGGNITHTAEILEKSRAAVYRLIAKHDIPLSRRS